MTDKIVAQKNKIKNLETKIANVTEKMEEVYIHGTKRKALQKRLHNLRSELDVEKSLLYRMEDK